MFRVFEDLFSNSDELQNKYKTNQYYPYYDYKSSEKWTNIDQSVDQDIVDNITSLNSRIIDYKEDSSDKRVIVVAIPNTKKSNITVSRKTNKLFVKIISDDQTTCETYKFDISGYKIDMNYPRFIDNLLKINLIKFYKREEEEKIITIF